MNKELIDAIHELNPWLKDSGAPIIQPDTYIPRVQSKALLDAEWDKLWLILTGPRQAGKTTLGLHLCEQLITMKRYDSLLYLNCDLSEVRQWLTGPHRLTKLLEHFELKRPIVFIDEVQRLTNPGLTLKAIGDLKLDIKMMASGSSQLEIKSTVQEYLTGRHLEALIFPLSFQEMNKKQRQFSEVYGCYPQIVTTTQKEILLNQLFRTYIKKDIIEILKVKNADVMQKLIMLIAHSSGQLVNYQQLATDCGVTIPTIQHYLSILENTYVLKMIKPYVGNKRTEITSNPIYYFVDTGFRNAALQNFTAIEHRTDAGLLVENWVFQEILKYRSQQFKQFTISYWRTKTKAEVDFILYKQLEHPLPIEVKYKQFNRPIISRAFRSFIEAYQPKHAILLNINLIDTIQIGNTTIHFVPLSDMTRVFKLIEEAL